MPCISDSMRAPLSIQKRCGQGSFSILMSTVKLWGLSFSVSMPEQLSTNSHRCTSRQRSLTIRPCVKRLRRAYPSKKRRFHFTAATLSCGGQARHNGSPWLVPCYNRTGAARLVDVLEECMKSLVVEYPEELPGVLKMTEEQFATEVRFLAAAKLFELGKLSSGKAAVMAGIGRAEFLHKLGAYGFYAI